MRGGGDWWLSFCFGKLFVFAATVCVCVCVCVLFVVVMSMTRAYRHILCFSLFPFLFSPPPSLSLSLECTLRRGDSSSSRVSERIVNQLLAVRDSRTEAVMSCYHSPPPFLNIACLSFDIAGTGRL